MRKLAFVLVIVALLLVALPVAATGPAEEGNFGGESDVWVDSGRGSLENVNNPSVRFDWDNLRIAVPGEGGWNAAEEAAVIGWDPGESLVDPLDTLD